MLVEIQQDPRDAGVSHFMSTRQRLPLSSESRPWEEFVPANVCEWAWCPRSPFVLLHPFCVWPLAPVPRLLLCCKEFCSELPYTFKKAATTSKTFMTRCLLITVVTLTSTQKEWQTSRYHVHTRMIQSNLLVPTEISVGKIKFWNQQTFQEKQACFSVDNTDLILTYNVCRFWFFENRDKFSFWLPLWEHSWIYFFFHCYD